MISINRLMILIRSSWWLVQKHRTVHKRIVSNHARSDINLQKKKQRVLDHHCNPRTRSYYVFLILAPAITCLTLHLRPQRLIRFRRAVNPAVRHDLVPLPLLTDSHGGNGNASTPVWHKVSPVCFTRVEDCTPIRRTCYRLRVRILRAIPC